jgi:hypothetical protein
MKLNKFAQMHHWAGLVTDKRSSAKKKLYVLGIMEKAVTPETREIFRMALAQVLRDKNEPEVRKEAISLLACYFDWNEIEWTFWLHDRRCPQDGKTVAVYALYAQKKHEHGFYPATLIFAVAAVKDNRVFRLQTPAALKQGA